MLEHIAAIDDVEAVVIEWQVLRERSEIGDLEALPLGVGPRSAEGGLRGVYAGDLATELGELFREQTATAADIQTALACRVTNRR